MKADGTGQRRLTSKPDFLLSWSPDHRRIAFVRTVSPNPPQTLSRPQLWVMNADGTAQRRLYARLGNGDTVALSPDWRKLAIDRRTPQEQHELYVISLDGSDARRFAGPQVEAIRFSWSPTSREIAFDRDNGRVIWGEEIAIAVADGSQKRRLVSSSGSPLWSPAGGRIAFSSKGGISVINTNGRARRLLIPWRGEISNLSWAPGS